MESAEASLEQIAERIPEDCFLVNLQYGDVNDEISQVAKSWEEILLISEMWITGCTLIPWPL